MFRLWDKSLVASERLPDAPRIYHLLLALLPSTLLLKSCHRFVCVCTASIVSPGLFAVSCLDHQLLSVLLPGLLWYLESYLEASVFRMKYNGRGSQVEL